MTATRTGPATTGPRPAPEGADPAPAPVSQPPRVTLPDLLAAEARWAASWEAAVTTGLVGGTR